MRSICLLFLGSRTHKLRHASKSYGIVVRPTCMRTKYMRQYLHDTGNIREADLHETDLFEWVSLQSCRLVWDNIYKANLYEANCKYALPHLESLFAIVWLASLNASSMFERFFLVKARDCLSRSRWFPQKICKSKEVQCTFGHIELPAKLLDYFLRSNKSNINQSIYLPMSHIRGRTCNQNVIVTIPVHCD